MELVLTQLEDYQVTVTCDHHISHTFDLQPLRLLGHWFERITDDPVKYGQLLFRALFPGDSTARQALSARPKRIVLVATNDELDTLPWEYLYGPDGFLVLDIPFVRGLPPEQRIPTPTLDTPLHIVAVPSNPLSPLVEPLNIDAEWSQLTEIIDPLPFNITLERVRPPTLQQVHTLLANKYQRVLHFMGHGGQVKDGAYLCFEKENGDLDLVEAEQLISRIRDTTFLITLNACVSASPGPTAFSNLAASIVKAKVPYALGMRFRIYDDDALTFSRMFYTELAQGTPVEEALLQARRSLAERPRTWTVGVPALYTSLAVPTSGFVQHAGASHIDEHQPRIEASSVARAVGTFQGRTDDLKRLGSLLTRTNRPQILTIHGGGGQGKTALAREATERFAYAWPGGVWGIMLDPLPDRTLFASNLAQFLSINVQELYDPEEIERRILAQLATRRILLVLDNAETLVNAVDANDPQATTLAAFIQQLPSTSVSLFVTSRIQLGWPGEITHELGGLTAEEGAQLFQQCVPQRQETIGKDEAQELSKKIDGHPLGLRLLGGAFNVSVLSLNAFIQQYEEQLVNAENKYVGEDHRHRKLYASIETSIRYLNDDLRNLLSNLWIFQSPFLPDIARLIFDRDTKETDSPIHLQLRTLWQRGLLARSTITARNGSQDLYYLLPTTRPYMQNHMQSSMQQEELQRCYGEAYEAFSMRTYAELDKNAFIVIIARHMEKDVEQGIYYVETSRQAQYKCFWAWILYRLGKTAKAQVLLEEALEQVQGQNQQLELHILNHLGLVYKTTGQSPHALSIFEQTLVITRTVGDRASQASTLNNMAIIYSDIGQPQRALDLFEQALPITHEVNDYLNEATILNNIAQIYQSLGQPQRALDFFEQSLSLMNKTGNRANKAFMLNNMGLLYHSIGQPQRALTLLEQSLSLSLEFGNRANEANTLNNIASVYQSLGQPQRALDLFEQAISLEHEVGDLKAEANALNNMAGIYQSLGQSQHALDLFEQSLSIKRRINDRAGEVTTLNNMAGVYTKTGHYQRALDLFEQSLPLAREVSRRDVEAVILSNIAGIYSNIGQQQRALDLYEQALPIQHEIGNRSGEVTTLHNIASLYSNIGQQQRALDLYEQALPILREVGNRAGEAQALNNIAGAYHNLGQPQKALPLYEQALLILREVGNRSGEATTLYNISGTYHDIGQQQRSISLMEQAISLLREVGDHATEFIALSNMACVLYVGLNHSAEALHYLWQARQLLKQYDLPQNSAGERLEQLDAIQKTIQQGLPLKKSHVQPSTIPPDIQQQWVSITIAVMTTQPEHRQEWRTRVEAILHKCQNQRLFYQREADFCDSLLAILDGKTPSLPTDHFYATALSAILDDIAQHKRSHQNEHETTVITTSHDARLTEIMHQTLAVLSQATDQQQAWREQLFDLRSTFSQQKGASNFVTFLDTLMALLDTKGNSTGLGKTLKDKYAQTWRALIDQLAAIKQQKDQSH